MPLTKRLLCMLLCATYITVCHAQTQTVTGTVTDSAHQRPLTGVTVDVKGTQTISTTDANGQFQIAVNQPATAVLVFSYVGFQKKEIPVSGQTSFPIPMSPVTGGMEEVVVVAYGSQKNIACLFSSNH